MQTKFRLPKEGTDLEIHIFPDSQLILITVSQRNEKNALLFYQQFPFKQLHQEGHLICSSLQVFSQALSHLVKHSPQNIKLQSDGIVDIYYTVNVVGTNLQKSISFPLKRKLEYQDQVRILREIVYSYEHELRELQEQMKVLKQENQSLSSRLGCIEQQLLKRKEEVKEVEAQKREGASTKAAEGVAEKEEKRGTAWEGDKEGVSSGTERQIQEVKQQGGEKVVLKLDVDPNCPYYDRFKIEGNTISSLIDDNYQVYWNKPLPPKGVVKALIRTKAKNHCSIGIVGQSELPKRYSFQSKNCVCLYTYYEGLFRGLYFRSQYYPLEWMINVNEVIEIEIDMTLKLMRMGLANSKHRKEIDIEELVKSQPLYFFIEMYEKDGVMEFL